jgi:hypothetical protein
MRIHRRTGGGGMRIHLRSYDPNAHSTSFASTANAHSPSLRQEGGCVFTFPHRRRYLTGALTGKHNL